MNFSKISVLKKINIDKYFKIVIYGYLPFRHSVFFIQIVSNYLNIGLNFDHI